MKWFSNVNRLRKFHWRICVHHTSFDKLKFWSQSDKSANTCRFTVLWHAKGDSRNQELIMCCFHTWTCDAYSFTINSVQTNDTSMGTRMTHNSSWTVSLSFTESLAKCECEFFARNWQFENTYHDKRSQLYSIYFHFNGRFSPFPRSCLAKYGNWSKKNTIDSAREFFVLAGRQILKWFRRSLIFAIQKGQCYKCNTTCCLNQI